MPKALERCVKHVKAKGHGKSSSYAICTSAMKKRKPKKGKSKGGRGY